MSYRCAKQGREQGDPSDAAATSRRLLGQVVQTAVDLQLWTHRDSRVHFGLEDVPLLTWLLGCLSLVLVVVTNEIVKLHEIRCVTSRALPLGPGTCPTPVSAWAPFPCLLATAPSLPPPGMGVCANLDFNLLSPRVRVRYQKRQKLQFETKLGMNSPF